jgi:hypothetical protein
MPYPGRWLVNVSFALWAFCALLVVAWMAPWGVDDVSCQLEPGSSLFGEATRSWLPPGTTCTWNDLRPGLQHVDSPSPVRLLVVAMAVLGPFASTYVRRLLRDSDEEA